MNKKNYRISMFILLFLLFLPAHPVQATEKAVLDWNAKGNELAGLGKYHEAFDAFNNALYLDGEYAPAWYGKGVSLNELGRFREANDAFDQALLRNENYVAAWNGKGVALQNMGRYDDSLRAYTYGLGLDPSDTLLQANRNSLLEKIATQPAQSTPSSGSSVRNTAAWKTSPATSPAAAWTIVTPAGSAQKAPPQKEMIYAKDITPPQVTSSAQDLNSAISLVSSPQDVSSADVGNALEVISSKGVIAAPTDNSTKNFLGAMDRISELGPGTPENQSSAPGVKKAPDFLSLLLKFVGLDLGVSLTA
nr:tetratricopeptide repeat protein [uncultured Methanoregula sp.]